MSTHLKIKNIKIEEIVIHSHLLVNVSFLIHCVCNFNQHYNQNIGLQPANSTFVTSSPLNFAFVVMPVTMGDFVQLQCILSKIMFFVLYSFGVQRMKGYLLFINSFNAAKQSRLSQVKTNTNSYTHEGVIMISNTLRA